MLLHVSGTMRPNAPLRPEYMKTSVYLPPIIIRDIPDWEQLRIIQMSQEFLEVVGTQTVTRFQNGVRNWNYCNGSEAPARPNMRPCCLPKPVVGSACYVIPGYAVEDSQTNDGTSSHSETVDHLRAENNQLRRRLDAATAEIARLKRMYRDLEDQVRHAANRVAVYHDASQTLSPPSTPSSRRHITPLAYNASPALLPPSTPSSYQCHMTSPADEELPEYTLTSPSL